MKQKEVSQLKMPRMMPRKLVYDFFNVECPGACEAKRGWTNVCISTFNTLQTTE